MRRITTVTLAAVAAFGVAALVQPGEAAPVGSRTEKTAAAVSDLSARRLRVRRAPTRIVITPLNRLYRHCVDWYAVERRPSGDVITPQMRCRWALR